MTTSTVYAGVHVKNKLSDFYPVHNIDMEQDVAYLKKIITEQLQLQFDANELDICYLGKLLNDDCKLSSTMKPNAIVHCFRKMKSYTPYEPPAASDINTKHIQELFSLTSHLQISVTSRFNILQKILAEYPEFRRNLGAQALIRDSVLFNMLHEPEVVQNLVRDYPLICDAASFIVDTIRKELARNSSATQFQEQAASESTTSSEEENSLGAGSSSSGGSSSTAAATLAANRRDELANIRQISRQQLANALARVDMSSFNSLSNIAQRNVDEALSDERPRTSTSTAASGTAAAGTTGGSAAAISSELLRNELARAFQSLQQQPPPSVVENMDMESGATDTSESAAAVDDPEDGDDDAGDDSDVLPRCYRRHRFTEQLRTMAAMGFINHTQNVNYLTLADGNVEHAINLLMLGMN
ncbi:PREDICTED: uncharacterized protein LOC108612044 [Drosophila arizonae]|uniref:Uncharacterized protein LOC108612044 n=1 Tax=Drosophila arizonae TaxID=7263 RepID=A0ABM1NZP4_DROAR|nr:PREDICTED: uncharacterized protein LOC108612044 [Drosophila arizonae]XP_017860430.1 PREDICTED: uncharacterized protein LOC108612044 [Drosophila arizonae]